jgi:hypothetical protein
MKRLLVLALALPLAAATLTARAAAAEPQLSTTQYVAMGLPSPAHRWTIADFIAAARVIGTLTPDKLPRRGSPMFTRMMSADNLVPLHDERPLETRGSIGFGMLPPIRTITEAYMKQPALNAGLDAEAVDALELTIAYFTEVGKLLDARASTLPAGAPPPPMRGVMAGVGSTALERLVDSKSYRLAERVRLGTSLAKSLPALLAHADAEGRAAIRSQLTAIAAAAKEAEIKAAVAKIAAALTV